MKLITLAIAAAAFMVAGCSQQATGAKADQASSATANNNYVDGSSGWTSGDKASWDKALKNRAEGQNDYVRSKSL